MNVKKYNSACSALALVALVAFGGCAESTSSPDVASESGGSIVFGFADSASNPAPSALNVVSPLGIEDEAITDLRLSVRRADGELALDDQLLPLSFDEVSGLYFAEAVTFAARRRIKNNNIK